MLVLYNADWAEDLPGTERGQDSEEVGRYYVRMHTDKKGSEKPYLLGLSCRHRAGHLNGPQIPEKSKDNRTGVVVEGLRPKDLTDWVHDSRRVELVLDDPGSTLDWESLEVRVKPLDWTGDTLEVVKKGVPAGVLGVAVEKGDKGAMVRFDALRLFKGRVEVSFEISDRQGRVTKSGKQVFHDFLKGRASRTGADGIRDDLHYVEDVENPVRSFLEDPKNRLPDGTLLKDHILYFVICYGLPRVTVSHYGIARGATEDPNNHSPDADLGQRLSLLYYDVETVMGFRVALMRYKGGVDFTRHVMRTGLARPMMGRGVNPFLHPLAFVKDQKARAPEGLAFTAQNRSKEAQEKFLYLATRIDGESPDMAKALIDNSLYASRYRAAGQQQPGGRPASQVGGRGSSRAPFWGDLPTYLPGAIDHVVISNNIVGWVGSAVTPMLRQNVTFTGGGAYGSPHITDASWWDDKVLQLLLERGSCLGDALQQNMAYEGWITSFFGDPLFSPGEAQVMPGADTERAPAEPPRCRVRSLPLGEGYAVEVRCDLQSTPERPRVAQLRATCTPLGGGPSRVQEECLFLAAPAAVVRGLKPDTRYSVRVEFQDPLGRKFESAGPEIVTGAKRTVGAERADLSNAPVSLPLVSGARDRPSVERGELELEFTRRGGHKFFVVEGKSVSLEAYGDKTWFFTAGGTTVTATRPTTDGELCRVLLVWSKEPLLREVYWKEGEEYRRVGAENRAVWRGTGTPDRLRLAERREVEWQRVVARAEPQW